MPPAIPSAPELSGRRALVTGAGRGVGRAVALRLALAGAQVLVNDLRAERADSVAEEITATGGDAAAAAFDVTEWDAVQQQVRAAGQIDILVNNAGNAGADDLTMADLTPFTQTRPDDWEPFLRVNLYGVMYLTRSVLPAMLDRGWGRIVTITSDAGRVGEPRMAAYSAAKAGAAGFCRAIAREVGPNGVTVNCVSLGTMTAQSPPAAGREDPAAARFQALARRYPVGRIGTPEDAAAMVAFLASPSAEWITGQTYPVNGGYSSAL